MFQRKKSGRIEWHQSSILVKNDTKHAFFERNGGVSPEPYASLNFRYGLGDDKTHVDLNYQSAFKALEIDPEQHIRLNVDNKDQIAIEPAPGPLSGYDAVIFKKGSASITVADCCPIIIVEPEAQVFALVHAGWFGATRRIVERTVQEMIDKYSVVPEKCLAAIGPTIGAKNYEIKQDVEEEVKAHLPEYAEAVLNYHDEAIWLDIPGAINLQLERMGVVNIDISTTDVYEDENFFSHRRDGSPTGRNGVFLSF